MTKRQIQIAEVAKRNRHGRTPAKAQDALIFGIAALLALVGIIAIAAIGGIR